LELSAAFARRGKGGAIREPKAGLTLGTFSHHTSRDLDPQLHTHVFVFNVAPRKDGTWGAIVSLELYKAQKQAGAIYREALATELERYGYGIERSANSIRVAAIPHHVERAFSKRREAIKAAAVTHGYHTPKGMEQAALRTRQSKRTMPREQLFKTWRAEAIAMGFDLSRQRLDHRDHSAIDKSRRDLMRTTDHSNLSGAAQAASNAVRELEAKSAMPGVAIELKERKYRGNFDCEPDR
jgi:conjugative relaxase-like TrwC/TraI family protein